MEYQAYETYETYETDPAYETDAAYDDMYGGKVKSRNQEQQKTKEDDAGKKNWVKSSHLEQGKNRENDASKTNLKVTVVLLGLIAVLLLVVVVLQIVPLASAGEAKPEVNEAENDKQCSRPYKILSDSWRKIDFNPVGSNCDSTLEPNWYRFSFDGNASYARIPSNPPAKKHQGTKKPCGTNRVAWMYGSLPTVGEPPKNVTMHWSAGYWNDGTYLGEDTYGTPKTASIVACRDELKNTFYIYSLVPPQRCNNAYCAIEE